MTTLSDVQDFLALHRLAVVGVSRNPKDFTRLLFRELQQRGYDAVPVNPAMQEVEGAACFANLSDVEPPVEGALLMTSPEVTEQVVQDCAAAGVHHIWMYRAAGRGAVSLKAAAFCAANGIHTVEGECPFMFLPETGWIHRAHGVCKKVFGRYPK
jgi:predicted CoA-binding protein